MIREVITLMYPQGSVRKVWRGPLRGKRFIASEGMRIRYAWFPNIWDLKKWQEIIKEGDIVFDVGANRGQLAMLFSKAVKKKGKVYSFEPMDKNIKYLRKNLNINEILNVDVIGKGVGGKKGKKKFIYKGLESKLYDPKEETKVAKDDDVKKVKVTTIKEFCKKREVEPDVVKVDVEGSAGMVLRGARQLLEQGTFFYVEIHNVEEKKKVKKMLKKYGYVYGKLEKIKKKKERVKAAWIKDRT